MMINGFNILLSYIYFHHNYQPITMRPVPPLRREFIRPKLRHSGPIGVGDFTHFPTVTNLLRHSGFTTVFSLTVIRYITNLRNLEIKCYSRTYITPPSSKCRPFNWKVVFHPLGFHRSLAIYSLIIIRQPYLKLGNFQCHEYQKLKSGHYSEHSMQDQFSKALFPIYSYRESIPGS